LEKFVVVEVLIMRRKVGHFRRPNDDIIGRTGAGIQAINVIGCDITFMINSSVGEETGRFIREPDDFDTAVSSASSTHPASTS
jgi:hypothetical protein